MGRRFDDSGSEKRLEHKIATAVSNFRPDPVSMEWDGHSVRFVEPREIVSLNTNSHEDSAIAPHVYGNDSLEKEVLVGQDYDSKPSRFKLPNRVSYILSTAVLLAGLACQNLGIGTPQIPPTQTPSQAANTIQPEAIESIVDGIYRLRTNLVNVESYPITAKCKISTNGITLVGPASVGVIAPGATVEGCSYSEEHVKIAGNFLELEYNWDPLSTNPTPVPGSLPTNRFTNVSFSVPSPVDSVVSELLSATPTSVAPTAVPTLTPTPQVPTLTPTATPAPTASERAYTLMSPILEQADPTLREGLEYFLKSASFEDLAQLDRLLSNFSANSEYARLHTIGAWQNDLEGENVNLNHLNDSLELTLKYQDTHGKPVPSGLLTLTDAQALQILLNEPSLREMIDQSEMYANTAVVISDISFYFMPEIPYPEKLFYFTSDDPRFEGCPVIGGQDCVQRYSFTPNTKLHAQLTAVSQGKFHDESLKHRYLRTNVDENLKRRFLAKAYGMMDKAEDLSRLPDTLQVHGFQVGDLGNSLRKGHYSANSMAGAVDRNEIGPGRISGDYVAGPGDKVILPDDQDVLYQVRGWEMREIFGTHQRESWGLDVARPGVKIVVTTNHDDAQVDKEHQANHYFQYVPVDGNSVIGDWVAYGEPHLYMVDINGTEGSVEEVIDQNRPWDFSRNRTFKGVAFYISPGEIDSLDYIKRAYDNRTSQR